jgi:hypothetical protein
LKSSAAIADSTGVVYDISRDTTAPLSLIAEYLPFEEDEVERVFLSCPLFVKKEIPLPQAGTRYDISFANGPPFWLFITHSGKLDSFNILYRDRPAQILERSDPEDLWKMIERCAHPRCKTQFRDWYDGQRVFLVKLEELGLFSQGIKEWQDRCQLQFEVTSTDDDAQLDYVNVYGIYEHHALRDKYDSSHFLFM